MTREERIMQAIKVLQYEDVIDVDLYGKEPGKEPRVYLNDMLDIDGAQAEHYVVAGGNIEYTDEVKFVDGYKMYARTYTYIKPYTKSPVDEEVPF